VHYGLQLDEGNLVEFGDWGVADEGCLHGAEEHFDDHAVFEEGRLVEFKDGRANYYVARVVATGYPEAEGVGSHRLVNCNFGVACFVL